MTHDWGAVTLELGLAAIALVVLVWDLFASRAGKPALYALALGGSAVLLAVSFALPPGGAFTDAYLQDAFALVTKQIVLAAGALTLLAAGPYAAARGFAHRSGELVLLLLFSMIGAMALASARELVTLFVAFELVSLPLYALAAIDKRAPAAAEGALKMFLFGSVSSAFMLLGVGLVASVLGTTFWHGAPAAHDSPVLALGCLLLLVAFGFKVALFPFYMWAPDTYQSSPTPIVAFLSVAPKAAGMVALFRLYFELFAAEVADLTRWVAVLAALSMIAGNLLALPQQNLKRLLAYSGLAHVGYALVALASGQAFGAGMALFYFVAYLFANGGTFLAIAALEAGGGEPTLSGVRDLVRRQPAIAGALLVFLLSLGGIPFVLGFWGKMYVFLAAGRAGLWWLVFLGAVLAVVALYYYLKIVRAMFIDRDEAPPIAVPAPMLAAVLICAAVVLLGGLWPRLFVEPALRAAAGFSQESSAGR